MTEHEKVLKGLECHRNGFCFSCPYNDDDDDVLDTTNCKRQLVEDTIALLKKLSAFKEYFDGLYGQGLEVANWHMNGDLEPFDNFYDSADRW